MGRFVCGGIDVSSDSSHFSFSSRALPGMSSWEETSLGAMRDLLMINATPADSLGDSGVEENIISIFLPNLERRVSTDGWSRWVSWSARTAILNLLSVLFTVDHLCTMDWLRAVDPLILSVAMLMLALLGRVPGVAGGERFVGVGERWWARVGAMVGSGTGGGLDHAVGRCGRARRPLSGRRELRRGADMCRPIII